MRFTILDSAEDTPPEETSTGSDGLPVRESGSWAEEKHRYLLYYSKIFNEAMKAKWKHRIYLEYFAGPGKCSIRSSGKETEGSVLKILDCDYTRFIFTEISQPLAEALRKRLSGHPKEDLVEIWVGDCNEALNHISIPQDALCLAFIDPTKIGHCPFELIQKTRKKSGRIDLLINIPAGMDIKRNVANYLKQQGQDAHLTRYLGSDVWRTFPNHDPKAFCRKVVEQFEKGLSTLRWGYVGRIQQIVRDDSLPLYYLFFASAHQKGQQFWDSTLKYCNEPELF